MKWFSRNKSLYNSGLQWYIGIGPKVTQSAITAAFLFAFKDAIYGLMVSARKKSRVSK